MLQCREVGLFLSVLQGPCDPHEFGLDKTKRVVCTVGPKAHSKAVIEDGFMVTI